MIVAGLPPHAHLLSHHPGIAAESPLPVGIIQHQHAGRTATLSVAGKDKATDGRLHLENREIIASHPADGAPDRTVCRRSAETSVNLVADDLAERLRLLAKF